MQWPGTRDKVAPTQRCQGRRHEEQVLSPRYIEAKEDAGGKADDKEMKVPSDVPVMTTPYTTITKEAIQSKAISGGALDNKGAQSRRAAVHSTPLPQRTQHGAHNGRGRDNGIAFGGAWRGSESALHCIALNLS